MAVVGLNETLSSSVQTRILIAVVATSFRLTFKPGQFSSNAEQENIQNKFIGFISSYLLWFLRAIEDIKMIYFNFYLPLAYS